MKRETLYAITGFLGGALLMTLVASNAVNTNNYGMMQRMGMNPSGLMDRSQQMGMDRMHDMMMGEGMSMSGMVEELQGKEGDAFDDAFTDLMIEHHQGAIDMAKLAQQYAGHDEVRDLADDIIEAQTSEIQMMKGWRNTWGF